MESSPPLVFRPAIIGLALAIIIVFTLVVVSGKTDIPFFSIEQAGDITEDQLPPVLFPVFPDSGFSRMEEMERLKPMITITKKPETRDVIAGSTMVFTIEVENISPRALRNLTVEDRFDSELLNVKQALGGTIGENIISWEIPVIDVEQTWTVQYEADVSDNATGMLEATAYVLGEDLIDMPSAIRIATSHLRVITLPAAGAELNWLWRLVWEMMN